MTEEATALDELAPEDRAVFLGGATLFHPANANFTNGARRLIEGDVLSLADPVVTHNLPCFARWDDEDRRPLGPARGDVEGVEDELAQLRDRVSYLESRIDQLGATFDKALDEAVRRIAKLEKAPKPAQKKAPAKKAPAKKSDEAPAADASTAS